MFVKLPALKGGACGALDGQRNWDVESSGNNYLMPWININQLKPFSYTVKIGNKKKIK